MRLLALFTWLAAMAMVGCKSPEDDLEPAFVPKNYAFEGNVDPKFVGAWTSTNGLSTLDLAKDGALKIQASIPTPSGKSTSNLDGRWLVSDGSLMMQYSQPGKGETVLKYAAKLSGNEMKLKQEGGRLETTYRRK